MKNLHFPLLMYQNSFKSKKESFRTIRTLECTRQEACLYNSFLSRVKQHVGQKIRQKSIVIRFPAAIHRCLGSEISYSNCPFFSASLKVALLAI